MGVGVHRAPDSGRAFDAGGPRRHRGVRRAAGDAESLRRHRGGHDARAGTRRCALEAADRPRRRRAADGWRRSHRQYAGGGAGLQERHDHRRLRHGHHLRLHHCRWTLHRRRDHARPAHRLRRAGAEDRETSGHRADAAHPRDRPAHGGLHSRRRSLGCGGRGGRSGAPHQSRMAVQESTDGRRDGGTGRSRRAVVQGNRIGSPRSDAGRLTDRGGGARPEVVTDARTLNASRRWGYRVLPGELYSYILHLRPAEWPIMAGHTLLGYILAVGLRGAGSGEQSGRAILALVIWVVFLNGGTLAINSVFDKDEDDLGYLNTPPALPRYLLHFSLVLLVGGQALAFLLPPGFGIAYAICFVLSILYSVPPFRFKAVAGVDWVINMWGFGTLTPFAGWAATGRPLDAGHALVLLAFCPLFAGLYPLTQLYQMEEDGRRGDRTLALLLGLRASLGVAIACIALAFALFGWAAAVLDVPAWLLAVPFVAWLAVLLPWYRRREMLSAGGHQRGMYRALVAWAVTDLVVLLVFAR